MLRVGVVSLLELRQFIFLRRHDRLTVVIFKFLNSAVVLFVILLHLTHELFHGRDPLFVGFLCCVGLSLFGLDDLFTRLNLPRQ